MLNFARSNLKFPHTSGHAQNTKFGIFTQNTIAHKEHSYCNTVAPTLNSGTHERGMTLQCTIL